MENFDLFEYLGHPQNPDAFIYRCGYYIINQYCNQNTFPRTDDSFYTVLDNMLLKFDLMQSGDIQFLTYTN